MNFDKLLIKSNWNETISNMKKSVDLDKISAFINEQKAKGKTVLPSESLIFNALKACSLDQLKVVILGQDPYHHPGQAHGLSFSVPHGVKIPPSLRNIYKELANDLGLNIPNHGNLSSWADQGVLLINAVLTVNAFEPASHKEAGWEAFTDALIEEISKEKENIVFMLWGKFSMSKSSLIDTSKHLVLEAAHPSPFSAHRGFFGCKHFSKANKYLVKKGLEPIDWSIQSQSLLDFPDDLNKP